MRNLFIIICIACFTINLFGQPVNDNCENALDITSIAFNLEAYEDLFVDTEFSGATVDPLNYTSNYCYGYSGMTTSAFPDVWLKSTVQIGASLAQGVQAWGVDTFEIATYFGTCGNLFQNDCYTTPLEDTLWPHAFTLTYFPHDSAHSMYFQLKAPPDFNGHIGLQFFEGIGYLLLLYFQYDNPADTNTTTATDFSPTTKPVIKLFPSPAKEEITIESSEIINQYILISSTGQPIENKTVNSGKFKVDASSLSPGIYFLRVETNNGWGIRSFVVTP